MKRNGSLTLFDGSHSFENVSKVKIAAFVLGCVCLLQVVHFLQHGTVFYTEPNVMPVFVGIILGLLLSVIEILFAASKSAKKLQDLEREQLYSSLKLSEERLSLATKQSSIWDWFVLTDDLYTSPSFAENLGYTQAELADAMQGSVSNLMHPDDAVIYRRKLRDHLANPEKGFLNEHRFRHKSGQYKWYLSIGQSTVDKDGRAIRFNGTSTDITERIDLENRLHQTQKLEAIGNLTGGIAHDFNNLLAVILGNLELLKDTQDFRDQEQFLDEAIAATNRGAELTKNMLGFAQRSHLDTRIVDLNELVRETHIWASRTMPENIAIKVHLAETPLFVVIDPNLAQTAILNLILNARDAMPNGGALTIETSRGCKGEIGQRDKLCLSDSCVELAIRDSGTGIDDAVLDSIFEPFFTTKPVGAGSGLGLSMVQGFVHQSGGSVHVETEPGGGTTIHLLFQEHIDAEAPKVAPPFHAKNQGKTGGRIILVEDDPQVLEVQSKMLRSEGYDILTAESGDEALSLFIKNKCAFDLLISDVIMPGKLQGPDLARELRLLAPQIPIIFLSGYSNEDVERPSAQQENERYLMKPARKESLLKEIADLLL